MDYDREIIPLHLGEDFPSQRLFLFGEVQERTKGSIVPGYTSLRIEFPNQTEVVAFSMDELPLWKSYVPSTVPKYFDVTPRFSRPKASVEAELVNPLIVQDPNADMLEIKGGPLLYFDETEGGLLMKHTNVLQQIMDVHSRLIRKSLVAMRRSDYRAARQVLKELIAQLRQTDVFSPMKLELEERVKELYINLIRDIASEPN